LILEDVEAIRAVDEEIVPSARYCFDRVGVFNSGDMYSL
jgi:hypothetical protein